MAVPSSALYPIILSCFVVFLSSFFFCFVFPRLVLFTVFRYRFNEIGFEFRSISRRVELHVINEIALSGTRRR